MKCFPGTGCAVEDQVKKLVEQLFTTQDLRAVQSLAVVLQRAITVREIIGVLTI